MNRRRCAPTLTVLALAAAATLAGGCGGGSASGGGASTIGVPSMLFVQRQTAVRDSAGNVITFDVSGGNNQVLDYKRYVPGGSLNLLSPARADGTKTNLTASFTA